MVTRQRLADYYRTPGGMKRLAEPVADLVAAGEAIECRVGEWDALCDPAAAELAESPPAPTIPVLLCPFDNLIWDREETRRLFGFSHALEIYKPKPDRVWGYYVLPLLAGDRIVGRVDLKSDRKAGLLRPLAVHWEGRPAPRATGPRDGAAVARAGASAEQRGERLEVVAHHAPLAEVRLDVVAAAGRIDLVGLRDRAGEILVAVDDQPRLAR